MSSPTSAVVLAARKAPAEGYVQEGGWGSNPRPADYEKPGPALRARSLHGYHGAVPPMALITTASLNAARDARAAGDRSANFR
jgi:hypothetical protein